MDPNECLKEMLISFNAKDFEDLLVRTNDLHSWIMNGGFCPEISREALDMFLSAVIVCSAQKCGGIKKATDVIWKATIAQRGLNI